MSLVKVSNIWAENIFEWVLKTVREDGGDGVASISCKNYQQAAGWFKEWYNQEYQEYLEYPDLNYRREYEHGIFLATDEHSQEGWQFTDQTDIVKFVYTFIVEEDVEFGRLPTSEDRKLIGVGKIG